MTRNRGGFSLVELAVVAGIMSVVLAVLYQASYVSAVSSKKGISKLDEMSKVNRLFEQLKRVLRTSRVVIEEQPRPFDFAYTIVHVDEIDATSRLPRNGRVKLARRAVPGQGIEFEFAKEGDRPIVYAFSEAVCKIYGARQELMIVLVTANGERHSVTVSSPYFDAAASNLTAPEMVVVDLLTGGVDAAPPAGPGGTPAATPGGGPMASLPGATQSTVRSGTGASTSSGAGPTVSTQGIAGPRTGTAAATGARPQADTLSGTRPQGLTGTAAAQPASPGLATAAGASVATGDSGVKNTRQPAGQTAGDGTATARTTRPPGLRPPPEADPMTWAGAGSIDPQSLGGVGTSGQAAGPASATEGGSAVPPGMFGTPPVGSGTVTPMSGLGVRPPSPASSIMGPTSAQTGVSGPAATSAGPPVRPSPVGGTAATSLPPARVRVDQLLNQRPPRGNQADIIQGSSVNNPFE